MSFQTEVDPYERSYARFLHQIHSAIQKTFAEEAEATGLTRSEIAEELGVDQSVISRRLNGTGNVTLRTISDIYTAMGREPLSNFIAPASVGSGSSLTCSGSVGTYVVFNLLDDETHGYLSSDHFYSNGPRSIPNVPRNWRNAWHHDPLLLVAHSNSQTANRFWFNLRKHEGVSNVG